MQRRIIPIVVFILTLIAASPCLAHKVRIFAWGEGDTIHTESKFSGGRAARGATVSVVDPATGTEILSGTTDESGLFDFKQPAGTTAFDIVINSGDGHKNSWHYEVEEENKPSVTVPATTSKPSADQAAAKTPTPLVTKGEISREELIELLDARLEAKLAPIRKMLAENEEKGPSLKDILGGLGYILGLAGLAAYMKAKPARRD